MASDRPRGVFETRYRVAIFDFAKALLPVALIVLLARRALLVFIIIGFAWFGLLTFSALATHATVSTAIAAIERFSRSQKGHGRGQLVPLRRYACEGEGDCWLMDPRLFAVVL